MATIRSGNLTRAVLVFLAAAALAAAQEPGARVAALLARMTLDEKLSLVHGASDPRELGQAGYWPGLARLGIPAMRFADGPPGINVNRTASGLPAPVGLAATFDEEAARLFGVVMGRNAAALEQNVVLAPHVNIVRDPLFRRNHTALSEDVLLSSRMGAAQIRGIQSQGVMAQVKHVAGYNGAQNVVVDERTLHEVYLAPFAAAIEAGVASAMCAYNKINGEWACENGELQNGILRKTLGFGGFVTSDWGAVHSPIALTRGLDLEMPGREIGGRRGGPYFTAPLKKAIESGEIPVAAVDRALGRILTAMERFGWLDRAPAKAHAIDVAADAKILRDIAAESAVLLRNENGALPLSAADLESLALVGPTAGQLAAGYMGERAYGFEERLVSPLAALRKLAPQARIAYSVGVDLTGVPIPASVLSHDGKPGLLRTREAADVKTSQVDLTLDFRGATALEAPADFAWSGEIDIAEEGEYTFLIQPAVNGGAEGGGTLIIDGRRVARTGGPGFGGTGMVAKKWSSLLPTTDGRDNGRGSLRLARGKHKIEISANSHGDKSLPIRLAWITPATRRASIDAAVAVARNARTAVVFAWSGTGMFEMPEAQDELIARVAEVARKTIVVLNTGGPVAMPWLARTAAIVEMWFPGQEGGWATADVLLGRVNPSGRLPVTFPKRIEDTAPYDAAHPERRAPQAAPGTAGTMANAPVVTYSEGLAVGYRWLHQQGIEPLFAFGHGLSYTTFDYANFKFDKSQAAVTVRNTGQRSGAEVVQVYVGGVLGGFARVALAAGEQRVVKIKLNPRAWMQWSVERHAWTDAPPREVGLGSAKKRE